MSQLHSTKPPSSPQKHVIDPALPAFIVVCGGFSAFVAAMIAYPAMAAGFIIIIALVLVLRAM